MLTNHFVVCATEKECRFADCDVQQHSMAWYISYHHLMNIIMHSPTPVWWNPEQYFLTRLSIGHYHSVRADLPFPSSPVRAHCCCRNSKRCYKVFVVLWQYSCEDPPWALFSSPKIFYGTYHIEFFDTCMEH